MADLVERPLDKCLRENLASGSFRPNCERQITTVGDVLIPAKAYFPCSRGRRPCIHGRRRGIKGW